MNWIQVLLIGSIVALLVYLLRSRRNARSRAWVKVGYVVFVLAGIYAVLRPDDTTVVAQWFGVRRGTDLMLYALVMAFCFTTLSTYMRFKDLELRYARLARAIALDSAQAPRPVSRRASAGSNPPCGAHPRSARPSVANPKPLRPNRCRGRIA